MGVVCGELSNWICVDQDSARRRGNLQNARSRRYQHHHRREIQKGTAVSGWKSVFKEWHHPVRGDIREDLGECGRRDHHQGVPPAHRPQARHYGVDVQGVDLSTNMNAISLEYRKQMEPEVKHRCHFYIEDADKMEFPENFFDIVYSRDTIMHFKDKEREKLYKNLLKTLKPGGKLMVSDYCRGEKPSPQVFIDYEAQRGYNLWTVKAYGQMLERTGFKQVAAIDKTNLMVNIMRMELKKFYEIKADFVKKFSMKDFTDIEEGWKEKLIWCPGGLMAWGLFIATK